MDFDFTTETITPNSTTLLTIGSTGGLEISVGTTAERPLIPTNGTLRYNSDTASFEGYEDSSWVNISGTNSINTALYKSLTNNQAATDPGSGRIKWNNATQTSSTQLYISSTTDGGVDITQYLLNVRAGAILWIQTRNNSSQYQRWLLTSITNNTGWFTLGVTLIDTLAGQFTNNRDLAVAIGSVGNTGVTSLSGTTNQVAVSAATGSVTLSTPSAFIAPGSLQYITQFGYTYTDITATGTNQATAALITQTSSDVNAGLVNSGVILPVPLFPGQFNVVLNTGSNQINIYPNTGAKIDDNAINASTYLVPGSQIAFIYDGGTWHSILDSVNSGNVGIQVGHAAGNVTISNSGVLSFGGGTTGLTPALATTGVVTLSGVLNTGNGGTGSSSTVIGFNNLSPLTLLGDILYHNGTNNVRLPIGSTNQQLTVIAGAPSWTNSVNSIITGTTGLLANGVNTAATGPVTLSGILALTNGGTNANLTAAAGGIVWSNATQLQIAGAGTTGQALVSGGATTPTWHSVASSITTDQIIKGNGSGLFTALGGTFTGTVAYSGVTLNGSVINPTDATTKAYVDANSAGLTVQPEGLAAQTLDLTTAGNGSTGPIATLGAFTAGTLYTDGTYTNVVLSSNNVGAGALATVVVAGGIVTSFTVTTAGNRYAVGDELYIGDAAGVNGIGFLSPVATVSACWGTVTYTAGSADLNGGTGIGATLAPAVNGVLVLDGTIFSVNDRVLIRLQTSQIENGIYVVSVVGSPSTTWLLTRASDYDDSVINQVLPGNFIFITGGKLNKNTGWTQTFIGTSSVPGAKTGAIKIGTDNIVYAQFSGSSVYTAGQGLSLIGTEFSNTGVLSNVAGTGISVSGPTGDVTITNIGVTSATAGTGISISGTGGPAFTGGVTISLAATNPTTVQVSTTYLVLAGDFTVFANGVAAGFTVSLPAVPAPGEIHNVKKIDQTRNIITISGNGNNIDKYTTVSVDVPFLSLEFQWNSTSSVWQII